MKFEEIYKANNCFKNRYLDFQLLQKYINELPEIINVKTIGYSTNNNPIKMLSIGKGKTNVIAWSQMHGNESNSTLSMLDFLNIYIEKQEYFESIFENITLDFILVLNPDGAIKWNRRNAYGIDLNRDFNRESSKEIKIFKEIIHSKSYHYALNLHEQRTIFTTDKIHPATLSFLAPSENISREITPRREKSMSIIYALYEKLYPLMGNRIGRYTDEFYPKSLGDNLMKMGIPTILFEGGHYENDYLRKNTRKFYTIALYYVLEIIANQFFTNVNCEKYFQIPENKESHFDLIYRNVKINEISEVDIVIQYKEIKTDESDEISLVPYVVEIGDCGEKKAWKEIDCSNKIFKINSGSLEINIEQNFSIL